MGRAPKELNLQGGLVVSAVCQSPMLLAGNAAAHGASTYRALFSPVPTL